MTGGDGWESNPPGTAQHRPTDGFEDRERHQPPNIPSGVSLTQVVRALSPLQPEGGRARSLSSSAAVMPRITDPPTCCNSAGCRVVLGSMRATFALALGLLWT